MTVSRLVHLFRLCVAFVSFASALVSRAEISASATSSNGPNPLVWDAMEKQADLPGMTNVAFFTFWVTNTAAAEATIGAVEAECDCTVVEARKRLPWTITPGACGPLDVRVNIRGRFGLFVKTVDVHTSHGRQVLTVRMKIPLTPAPANVSARQKDLMAAKADRQAVFRDGCAVCHAAPTVGLTGRILFEKACAICHLAEQRAEIVPDLAALDQATDADYWRTWITSGKAGSVMPAFAKSERGILDTNQIESLVEFLMKEFPSKNSVSSQQLLPTSGPANALPPSVLPKPSTGLLPPK